MQAGVNIENMKGEFGGDTVASGETLTLPAGAVAIGFTTIIDTTLLTYTSNYLNSTSMVGPTIPAGIFVAGAITSLEVDVGLVQVHYGRPVRV